VRKVKNKILLILAGAGILAGLISAHIYGIEKKALSPAFPPASNPYAKGIYSEGIIESYQKSGANINIFPEVTGVVARILISEGQTVHKGAPLIEIDDSVQRATVEQQKYQAEAALALLEQLRAQPRMENLRIAIANVSLASASLKNAQDQYDKQRKSYEINPKSVSKDVLDTSENEVKIAKAALEVANRGYELTKAGAWIYDIKNQEKQYIALSKAFISSKALLAKYVLRAPMDGMVMSLGATAVGSYVSQQGVYDTYTQGFAPVLVMGSSPVQLEVRCYIDEILVHRLPRTSQMRAQMFIRGTNISIPLKYLRVEPYVTPKIELSNQRTERVDVRVLPVIFGFEKPGDVNLYPGQLVDVYVGEQ
jgi:HlyD family secretion protein